jgi:general secretion pathway protein F
MDDQAGTVHEQLLAAENEQALRDHLRDRGRTLLSARRARFKARSRTTTARQRGRQYPIFCREIRTLITAGMTIVEAVETLSAKARIVGKEEGIASALLARLHQGQSLSSALEGLEGTPAVLIAAVRAGERTSNLAEALDDYLRFDTLMVHLGRKVVSASIYPALVTALGFGISMFLMVVVMPNFARMYENLRGSGSGATAWMISVSQFVSGHQLDMLAGLLMLAAVVGGWVTSGAARAQVLRAGYAIPWMRRRIEDFQLAMMYQALALLLKGGYPMTDAMSVTGRSALSKLMQAALQQARLRIEQGASVAQSLADANLCDEVGRRLMAAAERNGDFHVAADVVSRLHGERFELFVERATRIVEPLLLMAVALMVGTIVVMMYLPVFDMATRLR